VTTSEKPMLDLLQKYMEPHVRTCAVAKWIDELSKEEQEVFSKLMEKNKTIHMTNLFNEIQKRTSLPFKLTAFRSHMRGYCTCQK
jgi:hypothetical protein